MKARYWHRLEDGRIQCDLCPRECQLKEGQAGLCFIRQRQQDELVLTSYGRSSGFAVDPIEKKPLYHFYPGSSVLSFGTAGCNLSCKFCQNWDMSKARQTEILSAEASPQQIAATAERLRCRSVAYTYNDPVIFLEYAVDTAQACRERGIQNVAVTAGYISEPARAEFFQAMDAANVDLKGFNEDFYYRLTGGHLQPVLDTLVYIRQKTDLWLEITHLIIPEHNDDPEQIRTMCRWIVQELGADTPLHFSAFHPDYKLRSVPPTPLATLQQARQIALDAGLHYVYIGNLYDEAGSTTYCPHCQTALIRRRAYQILDYTLQGSHCPQCSHRIAGRFAEC